MYSINKIISYNIYVIFKSSATSSILLHIAKIEEGQPRKTLPGQDPKLEQIEPGKDETPVKLNQVKMKYPNKLNRTKLNQENNHTKIK